MKKFIKNKFFFTHPPRTIFLKKSIGEACYARGAIFYKKSGINWGSRRRVVRVA